MKFNVLVKKPHLAAKQARFLLVSLLFCAATAQAGTTDTWTGTAGDNNWATATNWSAGVPTTANVDDVVIGNSTTSRTINFALSSNLTLDGLSMTETSNSTNNVLSVAAGGTTTTLTDSSALTLGTSATGSTVNLTLIGYNGNAVLSDPLFNDTAGVAINSGGVLNVQFGATTPRSFLVTGGPLTVNTGGQIFIALPGASTTNAYPASFGNVTSLSLGGTDAFTLNNGGLIQMQDNVTTNAAAQFQVNGTFDWAGTIQAVATTSTAGAGNSAIILHGLTNTIESTALYQTVTNLGVATPAAPPLTLEISAAVPGVTENLLQTLTSAVNLGAVHLTEVDTAATNVYTHKLTYNGSGTGTVGTITLNAGGSQDILQLGSNWKTSLTSGATFITANKTGTPALANVVIDLNGHTFDGTSAGDWTPNKVSATVNTAWNITSSTGTGTLSAKYFNFGLNGTYTPTSSDSVTVGKNVILQATGGSSILSISGGATYSFDPTSTYLDTGTGVTTLASSATIGRLAVGDGTNASTLSIATSDLTLGGDITVNTNSNLNLAGFNATESSGVGATSGGLNGTGTVYNNTSATAKTVTLDTTGGNGSFSGAIKDNTSGTGTVALTKIGTGTQTLSGSNTYTGPTTISAGTLLVSGSLAAGSAVSVNGGTLIASGAVNGTVGVGGSTSVLGGSGKVGGAVTLSSGASLYSGGVASGTQTATGGMTLNSTLAVNGANLTFALGTDTTSGAVTASAGKYDFAAPSTNSTYLTVSGQISFTGSDSVSLVDTTNGGLTLRQSTPYLLVASTSGLDSAYTNLVIATGTGPNTTYSLSNLDGSTNVNGWVVGVWTGLGGTDYKDNVTSIAINQVDLNGQQLSSNNVYPAPALYLYNGELEVVPEPGTWAMMIGGLALLILLQRRRRVN